MQMDNMNKFSKSELWLKRAEEVIPLASQTFSKSKTQYPVGISPLFIERAKGAKVWDVDGNKYVDMVSALASVTIGYCDPGMNAAIKNQLKRGISFSLPGQLEAIVAEKIVEMIPSAEQVRFGKNGTDATSAAVRLARAYTSRDIVLACGYHGWQDWYIGATTRNKGVPDSVQGLTKVFPYNDISAFKNLVSEFSGRIAAVIMEPMNISEPKPGYLEEIRRITRNENIVLIFDETITGFRFANGGAQELFDVIPDLSTFGKGMGNGIPISAVVGSAALMREMSEIFFSGTFGGELLSLSATNYVLDRYLNEDIPSELAKKGQYLANEIEKLIDSFGLSDYVKISGHNSWKILSWYGGENFSSDDVRTLFMQEMFAEGVLILNSHNISLSHNQKSLQFVANSYSNTLNMISDSIKKGILKQKLLVKPNPPLFKIR